MEILIITGIVLVLAGIALKWIPPGSGKKPETTFYRFWGVQLILAGTMITATGVFYWLHFDALALLFGVLIVVLVLYSILQGLNLKSHPEKYEPEAGFVWLGIGAVLILTGAMILYFLQDPAIIMQDKHFEVRGPDGIKIHLDDFQAITIESLIPKIVDLYDGVHIGGTYRGKFELYRTGTSQLYLDLGKSPFIFIFLKSDIGIVITRDNPDETRKLYEEIKNYWYNYLNTDVINRLKKEYMK